MRFSAALLSIAILFASTGLAVAESAADANLGRLHVVWRVAGVSQSPLLAQLLLSRDRRTAIVATDRGTTAYSVDDGRVLWRRPNLRTPIALSGDNLVASTLDNALVVLQPATAAVLWQGKSLGAGILVLGADDGLVVACVRPLSSRQFPKPSPLVAFSAANGAEVWQQPVTSEIGEGIAVLPDLVVWSYSIGEPKSGYAEVFDRRTGVRRAEISNQSYVSRFDGTLWFETGDVTDGAPPAAYERYSATDASKLPSYTYFPDPHLNAGRYDDSSPMSSVRVPFALTDRSVFIEIGEIKGDPISWYRVARLYRYDRRVAPDAVPPHRYDVHGELAGAVLEDGLLLHTGNQATLLLPEDAGTYTEHRFDLSEELQDPTRSLANGSRWDATNLVVVADSATIAFLVASDARSTWLMALTRSGKALFADRNTCSSRPSAIVLLPSGDALTLCGDVLVRVTPNGVVRS